MPLDDLDSAIDMATGGVRQSTPSAPANDPLDSAIDQSIVETRLNPRVRVGLIRTVNSDPNKAAEAKRLSQQTGIPMDVVERNLPEVKKRSQLETYQNLMLEHPALAKSMERDDFSRMAGDDMDALTGTEQAVRQLKHTRQALAASLPSVNASLYGVLQAGAETVSQYVTGPMAGTILPEDPAAKAAEWFAEKRKLDQELAKAWRPQGSGFMEQSVYSGLESLGQNLLLMPLSIMSGNPTYSLSTMSAATGGDAYGKARDVGVPVAQALNHSLSQAAIEYATELIPVTRLVGDLKANAGFMTTLAHNIAAEVPGEQVATVLQDLNDWATLNPEKPFADYLKERPSAAAQTLIATVVSSGGQVSTLKAADFVVQSVMARRNNDAQATTGNAQALVNLFNAASQSLTRTRDAQSFAQLVQDAADENGAPSHVYINGQVLAQTLQQAGINPGAMPLVAAALPEAIQLNKDVALPIGEVTAALSGTGLEQALIPNVKFEVNGPTVQEAQQVFEQQSQILREEADKAIAKQQDADAWTQSSQAVYDNIMGQLGQANRFTGDVNAAYAMLVRDFYTATAGRMNTTPEALYQQYPLRIVAESPVDGVQYDQDGKLVTDSEPFKTWFGDSEVVDAEGKPLVVYHGTDEAFDTFDRRWLGRNTLGNASDPAFGATSLTGFWFNSGEIKSATNSPYSSFMEGYLRIENAREFESLDELAEELRTVIPEDYDDPREVREAVEQWVREQIDDGYDGIALADEEFGGTSYVVFNPEQIKSAVGNRGQFNPNDPNILHQAATVDEQIGQWAKGELKANVILDLGITSPVLQSFGAPAVPITLRQSVLSKAGNKHKITPEELRGITRAVQYPLAVFASKKGEGHLVALTELRHAEGNIVAMLDLNKTREGLEITDITSLHPKHDEKVLNWVEDGLLLGVEKTKGREWLEHSAGSNSRQDQVNAALANARIYESGVEYNQKVRGTFNPATLTMALMNAANLSTFIHETGHFFLEMVSDLAAQENAPAQIKADMRSKQGSGLAQ